MSIDDRVNHLINQRMTEVESRIESLEGRIKGLEEEATILHEEIHSAVKNMTPPKTARGPVAKTSRTTR